jgi:hypothetical protein
MISARLALAALISGQIAIACTALAAGPQSATSPQAVPPPAPERNPVRTSPAASGDVSQPPPAAQPGPTQAVVAEPDKWSPAAIAEAKAHCAAVLKGLDVTVIPEEPIKHGTCGAAAPVQLVRLGKNPEVAVSPPAVVTCDMVVQLDKWVRSEVQPLARKLLGAPVVKIETMSSYSCRNAYGRAKTNLSEHGRANALDIGGFVTANAETTKVLVSWGPTERELKAQALAAAEAAKKAAAEKAAAELAATQQAPQQQPESGVTNAGWTGMIATQLKGMIGTPVVASPAPANQEKTVVGFSRLGGPNTGEAADTQSRSTQFLRQIHAAACKYFGTVLGPEANDAHKNHLHLDMAERQRSNFCE